MALVRIGGNLQYKIIVIAMAPDTMPGSVAHPTIGGTSVTITSLGTFEHAFAKGETDDVLPGSEGHGFPHTLYQHVVEVLYKRDAADLTDTVEAPDWPNSITDVENWHIMYSGVYATSTGMHAPNIQMRVGQSAAGFVTKHLPDGTTIATAQLDYVMEDTGVATVASNSNVTPVAPGRTRLAIKRKDRRFETDVLVHIMAAELTATRSAQGAGALGDYEYSWTLAGGVGPFTIKLGTADPIPYVSGDALDVVSAGSKTVVIKDTGDSVSPQQTVTQTFTATTP